MSKSAGHSPPNSPFRISFERQLTYHPWEYEPGPPIIEAHFYANDRELRTFACVDTGADGIFLAAEMAHPLGISVYDGDQVWIRGINRPGFKHRLGLYVPELDWQAEVDATFLVNTDRQYALLGRQGFLNEWTVAFREYFQQMYFAVEDHESD